MRYGFVTCVQLGKSCIEEVLNAGGHFEILMTLRDDLAVTKSGRAYLDDISLKHNINLTKVRNINDPNAVAAIQTADLDWLFVIGWSQIARAEVLNSVRLGVIGIHPTLLPSGRGRAAIPWTIINGLDRAGVTMFKLDEGVDTGPILSQHQIPLDARESATTLYGKVNDAHLTLIREVWPQLESSTINPVPQNEALASEWEGRRPEDGEIHPNEMTVGEVDRLVRAVTHPYPGAFIRRSDDQVLRIWSGSPVKAPPVGNLQSLTLKDGYYQIEQSTIEQALDRKATDRNKL